MRSLIVAETCPAPECNLSPRDVKALVEELKLYHAQFGPAFRRPEQSYWSGIYLKGLLGDEPRKSAEPIALQAGVNVRGLQYFVGQSPWLVKPVLSIHHPMIGETLGEDDAVAIIDESGVVKQGEDSVGVGHQYSGQVVFCGSGLLDSGVAPPPGGGEAVVVGPGKASQGALVHPQPSAGAGEPNRQAFAQEGLVGLPYQGRQQRADRV